MKDERNGRFRAIILPHADFVEGWMRFWITFTFSLPTILGFGAAVVVWDLSSEIFKALVVGIWKNLR